MKRIFYYCFSLLLLIACENKTEQNATNEEAALETFEANYDEAQIPEYELPQLLVDESGQEINSVPEWEEKRKPWIYEKFASQVYGQLPGESDTLIFEIAQEVPDALGGKARAKEVKVYFTKEKEQQYSMDLLIYLPKNVTSAVPVFLGLNFYGNQTISSDSFITINQSWMRNNEDFGVIDNQATEKSRGVRVNRWPLEMIIEAGYGLATIYYGDLDPDKDNPVDWQDGIHPLFYREGQVKPDSNQLAAIGAWAWGLSRAVDYMETDQDINKDRIALIGHSRLGKAALWAGASDTRFNLVISNNSGCGGAALSRRAYGETVGRINNAFPHWFCQNFHQYNNNESELPVDQHMLLALIAPRPLYVASAEDDQWADPKGEFLSAKYASKVYELYGKEGLSGKEMPAVNQPLQNGSVAYHIRTGKHDVTDYDWEQYLQFAKQQWQDK